MEYDLRLGPTHSLPSSTVTIPTSKTVPDRWETTMQLSYGRVGCPLFCFRRASFICSDIGNERLVGLLYAAETYSVGANTTD